MGSIDVYSKKVLEAYCESRDIEKAENLIKAYAEVHLPISPSISRCVKTLDVVSKAGITWNVAQAAAILEALDSGKANEPDIDADILRQMVGTYPRSHSHYTRKDGDHSRSRSAGKGAKTSNSRPNSRVKSQGAADV